MFFSVAKFADANIEITEIMYAPVTGSGYEWIEIYNNGSSSIDLNKNRFFHGTTNSGPLTLRNGSSTVLAPSEYAIIAKSMDEYSWLNFSGKILSASTLSLPDKIGNTYIAISDPNKKIIESVSYDPSKGGSKTSKSSLAKINGVWKSGIPTPGKENIEMIITPPKVEEKPVVKSVQVTSVKKSKTNSSDGSKDSSATDSQVINLNDLDASAGDAGAKIPNQIYPFIGLIIVIGIGIASFLLVKKNSKTIPDYPGKEITANDMTIVE